MPTPKYLYIHDWRVHQTYREDRGAPPWIKIHRSLLRNEKWILLSESQRGQLISMWLLAADNDGRVINDAHVVQIACGLENEPDLNYFISLGLFDDKTRRKKPSHVRPEAETETETDSKEAEKKESLSVRKRTDYPIPFEYFWDSIKGLCHKTPLGSKKEAFNEWGRASKEWPEISTTIDLVEHWKNYHAHCRQVDQNTKHVCRWIKYRGWEDDYDPPADVGNMVDAAIEETYRRKDKLNGQSGNSETGDRTAQNLIPATVGQGEKPT